MALRVSSEIPVLAIVLLCTALAAPARAEVEIEWISIGNADNPPDTRVMDDGTTGYGAVAYAYRIAKHEVTLAQYVEFLNAVAADDPNDIFTPYARIDRIGEPGSYTYVLTHDGEANEPVREVAWTDAARFANWMHNGQPSGAQDQTTTEDGAYDMARRGRAVRKAGATVFLPSEDEWYKAAYYEPVGRRYFQYPCGTDAIVRCRAPTLAANSANCGHYSYPPMWTDVGSYPNSPSPYGTFDQGGNAAEWNEAFMVVSGWARGIRGGSYDEYEGGYSRLASSSRYNIYLDEYEIGFRLASVHPPQVPRVPAMGGAAIGILGLALLLSGRIAIRSSRDSDPGVRVR